MTVNADNPHDGSNTIVSDPHWHPLRGLLRHTHNWFSPGSARTKFGNAVVLGGLLYAMLASLIIVMVSSTAQEAGVALALAFASAACGSLVGFIFAVPKRPEADGKSAGTKGQILSNTNLGQVSDWLSKIVIGLGLVQFRNLLDGIRWLGSRFALTFAGSGVSSHAASTYGVCIVLFGSVLGFLMMYMWTASRLAEVWEVPSTASMGEAA